MMQILFCTNSGIVRIVYLLKVFMNLLKFVLPIILIVMTFIDIYKNILFSGDSKNATIKKTANRLLACIIVFCVPTFINLLMALIGKIGFDTNSYKTTFATCYTEATPELIETLEEQEKLKISKEEEAKKKEALEQASKMEAEREAKIEENKKNNASSGGEYKSNLTDLTKQNQVYIENGTFYVPKYVSGNQSTYSGKNCPKDPENEGYNNKYGYNNYFWTMLQNLKKGAQDAGYNLDFSTQGCRSYSIQKSRYDETSKSQPGRFAKPGKSKHGWGIASDVEFYVNSTKKCSSSRTYKNCPGMKWVHDHAKDYGLEFSQLDASFYEDWHIQPLNLKEY